MRRNGTKPYKRSAEPEPGGRGERAGARAGGGGKKKGGFRGERGGGAYVLKQTLMGRQRYPLVLMLEPLFRCNLACFGCGKIDYPDPILNRRLSVKECSTRSTNAARPWSRFPAASR